MQSYKEDNKRLVKAQEEQNHLNEAILQSLTDIQRKRNSGHRETNPKGTKSSARRRKRPSSGSSNSEGSTGVSSSSSCRNKRKRHYRNNSCDEFKK